jgi:hypothetical protein
MWWLVSSLISHSECGSPSPPPPLFLYPFPFSKGRGEGGRIDPLQGASQSLRDCSADFVLYFIVNQLSLRPYIGEFWVIAYKCSSAHCYLKTTSINKQN